MGELKGKRNGDLLQAAVNAGYDVFVTVTKAYLIRRIVAVAPLLPSCLVHPPTSLRTSGCLSIRCCMRWRTSRLVRS